MEKFHGIRKASQMTKNIPASHYIQISLDTAGSEIVTALRRGDAAEAWRRYQSDFIYPVLNAPRFVPEAQIAAAAAGALETAAEAQALAERENAVRMQRREPREPKRQMMDGMLELEACLAGSGRESPETGKGKVLYCPVCLATGCEDPRHGRYPVDELIFPFLRKLHIKGYQTKYCCSGHAYEVGGEYHTYITFAEAYAFAPPKGYFISRPHGNRHVSTRLAVIAPPETWRQKVPVEDAQKTLDHHLAILEQWVNGLPDLKRVPYQVCFENSYASLANLIPGT